MRRMLINAQNREELRIAVVNDTALENFQLEVAERGLTRGNIYRGVVASVQPSLNAAFIDYGAEKHGFLSIQDVVDEAFHREKKGGRPRIEEVLERGKTLVVQVTKEAEAQKGGGVTTNLSLAGRYLVLTPYDDTRGVSRKVEDDETRKLLKEQANSLKVPEGAGFIVRTNALDQTKTSLARDFAALARLWKRIQVEAKKGGGPKLLHSDQDTIIKTLRDYLDTSIDEVLIDSLEAFEEAEEYVRAFLPRTKTRLIKYEDREPLFSRFGIEAQIDRIYERSVPLPSGGSIVIDRTEALIAIDVNSGRSTRAGSQEETAVNTNVEAAREVARQLRLRDIGGLVVVDFIDMRSQKNQGVVEKTLKDALKTDKARSSVGRISENGLLEINRQRIQQALHMRTHRACPTCQGTGRTASPEMVGLHLLREIEARVSRSSMSRVRISLHPELADAVQNGRRQEIAGLEREFGLHIEVIAATHLHRPQQEIEWFERSAAERAAMEPATSSAVTASQAPKPPAVVHQPSAGDIVASINVVQSAAPLSEGSPASKRPKRRRRRRKHSENEDQPTELVVRSLDTDEASDTEPDPQEAPATFWVYLDAPPIEPALETVSDELEVETGAPVEFEPGAESQPKAPRPRRRRRRSRGHGSAESPTNVVAEQQGLEFAGGESEGSEESPQGQGEEGGTQPKPKRRRPRRRRSSRTGEGASEPADSVSSIPPVV